MGRILGICSALTISFVSSASAETTIIRPGACAAQSMVLLADNSRALILVEPFGLETEARKVVVFRERQTRGWASQRLLRRFDVELDSGPVIINSGTFCRGGA